MSEDCGCGRGCPDDRAREAEREKVTEVIRSNIRWALTKDTEMLYGTMIQDERFFMLNPRTSGTIRGFDAMKEMTERVFLNESFKGVSSEFKDLRVELSGCGCTAWFSCILDDRNTWDGKPFDWIDVRWTGVLEKIDGKWRIMQMHFSEDAEK